MKLKCLVPALSAAMRALALTALAQTEVVWQCSIIGTLGK